MIDTSPFAKKKAKPIDDSRLEKANRELTNMKLREAFKQMAIAQGIEVIGG
ncbi:MAG: hypothetical protein AAF968_05475 [Pseudomonadota bacterium]